MRRILLRIFLALLFLAHEKGHSESRFTELNSTLLKEKVQNSRNWNDFHLAMEKLKKDNKEKGTSYIITGSLVTIGSLYGIANTDNIATKLLYGLTSGAGVAAITYGFDDLHNGNTYNSFYHTLLESDLSTEQKNSLVQKYLQNEKELLEQRKQITMLAHFLAGAINLYSLSREKDESAKTFFGVLAGVNFSLGISYCF